MIAYSYDENAQYTGPCSCQIDPVRTAREGRPVYLLPANAVEAAPGDYDPETQIPMWNGDAWILEDLPIIDLRSEPEPEPGVEPEGEYTAEDMLRVLAGV